MTHSVRQHLRVEIARYDETIRQFIPGYETMLSVAAGAIAASQPELVIDLGAGTGALTEACLEREGVGSVELLDVDPEMLGQARARLARFGARARFNRGSYDEAFEPADAFGASLSLHHIPTLEAKRELYARAYRALRSPGVLVNADVMMPAEAADRDRLFRFWADHLVSGGIPKARAWQHFREWAEEDTYFAAEQELEALRCAGFEARQIWASGPVVVIEAAKR